MCLLLTYQLITEHWRCIGKSREVNWRGKHAALWPQQCRTKDVSYLPIQSHSGGGRGHFSATRNALTGYFCFCDVANDLELENN